MTTTSNSNTQPGIGSKIKGAAQVVHGLGENVRGSILGGVDTVMHQDSSPNDAIAAKGRAEHATGAAKMKGGPVAAEYTRPAEDTNNHGPGTGAPAGTQAGRQTDPTGVTPQTGADYSGGLVHNERQPQYDSGPPGTGAPGAGPTNHQGYTATGTMNQESNQTYPNQTARTGTNPTGGAAGPQAPNDSRPPVPGTGAPSAHTTGPDTYPTKQQGYNATDATNQNSNHPHHDHAGVAQKIPDYDGPGNKMQAEARHDRPAGEPQHHRDDAVTGAPAGTGAGQQSTQPGGVPPAYVAAAGGPPADVGAQFRGEEVL